MPDPAACGAAMGRRNFARARAERMLRAEPRRGCVNMSDNVRLVPYDPSWPGEFEAERARIAAALGDMALRIDHVGAAYRGSPRSR